ncbi:putative phd finger and set domain [Phaeomoniella chlamydospora]|uniref:Putative phd finger and set domain n=1 Tax=Phaeomoniella chlamydospora TaxID=158046 RepID=A0A0G2EMX0_PHACM|nr:putative phd finger and set domain [Phaeomoniella chlamydospora]
MTDTSSVFTTQSTPQLNPVTAPSLASPIINGSLSDNIAAEDDEPYTIKCICAFQDDDGNTVFCEKCETWQHIECYYHGKKVPEVHNCADCEPRPLDGKRATERQRRLREQTDGGDRKAKRASSKSHKKKTKDTDSTNGWHSHDRHDSVSGSREPPTKRPKTSHRQSGSVSSMNGVLGSESRKRAHSTTHSYPSPTKSPSNQNAVVLPQYTSEFLQLYDDDPGQANLLMRDNFNTINVTRRLKSWLQDPIALSQDANGRLFPEVFLESDAPLKPESFPPVSLDQSTNLDIEIEGKHPRWQKLTVATNVPRDGLVGEIKGSVGLLRDYCLDPANRWKELRHPEPFVFFHPQLPIYIDSRREGTVFRYLRRSCRPNVTMKTYIDSQGEYHYCFAAKEDIPAGSELTTTWYLDQAVLNRHGIKEEITNERDCEFPPPEVWASRVLATFGDCACDGRQPCMLAPLDRRRPYRSTDVSGGKQGVGRKKKSGKSKHMSPPINGRRSTSRAGSEVIKGAEDEDQSENRSTSGSVRSKPRSRDMTPTNAADVLRGFELTDRERRKIAAAEKTFERLEQDQSERKKKKRPSGGSTLNTSAPSASKQLGSTTFSQPGSPSLGEKPHYVDAGTSRQYSTSPPASSMNFPETSNSRSQSVLNTPALSSSLRCPTYVDSAVQTEDDQSTMELPPAKRRKFTTMTQRLLKRCYEDRLKYEEMERRRTSFTVGNALPSPVSPSSSADAPSGPSNLQRNPIVLDDTDMKDISSPSQVSSPTTMSPNAANKASVLNDTSLFPPPPLPSQAAHTRAALQPPNGHRLQLTNLPPVPNFTSSSGMPTSTTPSHVSPFSPNSATSYVSLHAAGPMTANTASSLTAPSPVKKKLSLGDYMSRRNATPSTEKTQAQLQMSVDLTAPESVLPVLTDTKNFDSAAPPPDQEVEATAEESSTTQPSLATDVAMIDASDPPSDLTATSMKLGEPAAEPGSDPPSEQIVKADSRDGPVKSEPKSTSPDGS